ncbi:hypothetical protein GALMADRAFT_257749 [Galerina marginata CBS 339.88]|uniref:Uncharacterized protein n=1 Tax=Galerina marginata (strain CBS 339.88) TaxID=685588 RepID=A0A067SAH7_GALM3|nr:hypothetical protein GALMADRAFT_257749 [Galerina marginata CBS 339.88]
MDQDWRGARITSGAGGAGSGGGIGGRGGDIGSNNTSDILHTNSHNDNSFRQRVNGDNYGGSVDQGDKYNGNISNSAVGGRGNANHIVNNHDGQSGQGGQGLSAHERELNERLAKAREKLAAKREKERLQKLEDELKKLEAELAED